MVNGYPEIDSVFSHRSRCGKWFRVSDISGVGYFCGRFEGHEDYDNTCMRVHEQMAPELPIQLELPFEKPVVVEKYYQPVVKRPTLGELRDRILGYGHACASLGRTSVLIDDMVLFILDGILRRDGILSTEDTESLG